MLCRCAIALALCVLPASAGGLLDLNGKPIDDYTFRISARAWLAGIEGETEVSENDFDGSKVDLEDDLDLDRDQIAGEGLLELRLGRFRIQARYFQQDYDEENTVQESFTYKGTTYSTFDEVDSQFKIRSGGVDAEFMVLDLGSGDKIGFELGLGLGARYVYAEGAIKRDPGGPREREDSDAIIPVARASMSLHFLNCLAIEGDAEAMHIRYREVTTSFLDATLMLKLYLHHHAALGVGYRYVGIELEDRKGDDDFDIELSTRGFFAELSIQF